MKATLYALARNTLSQERRTLLKGMVGRIDKRLKSLDRRIRGPLTDADIISQISPRLPPSLDILFVHCSYNSLSSLYEGDAFSLLATIRSLVRQDQTLAMPTFFFGGADYDVLAYYREKPLFKARRTPSQVGLVSEIFRRQKGVLRSLHPTHSVAAIGPLAEELTQSHHLVPETFGAGSPFDVMARHKTAILGIGAPYYRVLTQVHAAEPILGEAFPAPHDTSTLDITLQDSKSQPHPYTLTAQTFVGTRHIDRLGAWMHKGDMTTWTVRGIPFFLTDAQKVTEAVSAAARQGRTIYG